MTTAQPGSARASQTEPTEVALRPRLGTGFVSRQRLLDRLSPSSETALLAPLGYGKTSLLIDHAERQDRPVAWLTLDSRDNDPVVLVSRIVTALDRVTAVDDSERQALAAPGVSIWGRLMPRLAATIARLPSCLIVLDDIHEIASDDARDVIAWLALHMPQDAQLIISGRSGEGLPLARLRIDGRLLDITAGDVALDDKEALDILLASGVEASSNESARTNLRCEGWAAGVRLAALTGATKDISQPSAQPSGSDRVLSCRTLRSIPATTSFGKRC
jgi:LuxR family maltose regulon positive regulatory protein